ncbi:hypothetical protein [Peterkaempfera griseoplana]|uniref:hypothetical protein n=1 Tax=Peterkaempfera griseoplana TaxID=66896 RepID=UPI0006E3065E|nr:hypothetical protein [Peterkaempfera griseoplana]
MQIPKDKVVEFIRSKGDEDLARQAEQQLPDQIDPKQDAGQLKKFGVQPQELLSKIGHMFGS